MLLPNVRDNSGIRLTCLHPNVATQFRSCDDWFRRLQFFCLYILSCTQMHVTNWTIVTSLSGNRDVNMLAKYIFVRLACSRLSVSEDDRKSKQATSRISCERDPGVKRRGWESLSHRPLFLYQTPLVARQLFQSSTLTESLEQANVRLRTKLFKFINFYRYMWCLCVDIIYSGSIFFLPCLLYVLLFMMYSIFTWS